MYPIHLATGSEEPPLVPGKLRLYSMEFCPFAQRARLVLKAKNIPHDTVNINLIDKPEWFFKRHPKGLVPTLVLEDDTVIVESLDVANYLDEKYPNPPLYSKDRASDEDLIEKMGSIGGFFYNCAVNGLKEKTAQEYADELTNYLEVFESALKTRGTKYFVGNDRPGMVDYILWPWAERSGMITIALGTKLPLEPDRFPLLRQWKKDMKLDKAVSETYHGPEKFWKSYQIKMKQIPADYDSL